MSESNYLEAMKRLPLKEYYDSLVVEDPRITFRDKLAKECDVTIMTVYRWINGEVVPDKLKRERIAEIVGVSVEELFPGEKR